MNNIALLTARKGSKLKDKCFLKLNNKSCISYVMDESKIVSSINQFFCSSDSQKIINLAEISGFKPILRPKELASDEAAHVDVIKHFLNTKDFVQKRIYL